MEVDPDLNVTVTCGATEAMASVFMALLNPGDEVIIPEPFYENYGPDAILAGANPVFVPLDQPDWKLNPDSLRKAFNSRTKAIIVNTPHNPTGRVFTREEMSLIASSASSTTRGRLPADPTEHMVYSPSPRDRDVARHARAHDHSFLIVEDWSATGGIGWIIHRRRKRRRSARCTIF
jgi:aminotransferase